jgi:hypothetical protein
VFLAEAKPGTFDDFKNLFMNTLDKTITEDNFNLIKDKGNELYDLIHTSLGNEQTQETINNLINQARARLENNQNDKAKEKALDHLSVRLAQEDQGQIRTTQVNSGTGRAFATGAMVMSMVLLAMA